MSDRPALPVGSQPARRTRCTAHRTQRHAGGRAAAPEPARAERVARAPPDALQRPAPRASRQRLRAHAARDPADRSHVDRARGGATGLRKPGGLDARGLHARVLDLRVGLRLRDGRRRRVGARGRARTGRAIPLHAAQPDDRRRGRDPPPLRRRPHDPARLPHGSAVPRPLARRLADRRLRHQQRRGARHHDGATWPSPPGSSRTSRAPRSPRRRVSCSSSASSRASRSWSRASSPCRTSSSAPIALGTDPVRARHRGPAGRAASRRSAARSMRRRSSTRCGGIRCTRATPSMPGCASLFAEAGGRGCRRPRPRPPADLSRG